MSMSKHNKKPTMADKADLHSLYEKSVQSPEADIEFFINTYKSLRGKEPMDMREDFCGTGYLSVEWCKSHPQRRAQGIDLDRPTLDWGLKHNVEPAGPDVGDGDNMYMGS